MKKTSKVGLSQVVSLSVKYSVKAVVLTVVIMV